MNTLSRSLRYTFLVLKELKAGNQLIQLITANSFFIHVPVKPTFHPRGRGRASTLDLVVSNNLVDMSISAVLNELSSDHLSVIFEIALSLTPIAKVNSVFNFHRADWVKSWRIVDDNFDLSAPIISEFNGTDSIDSAIVFFKSTIMREEGLTISKLPIRSYAVSEILHILTTNA